MLLKVYKGLIGRRNQSPQPQKKVGVKKRASEERVWESDIMANGAFAARLSHARREKEIQYTN